MRTGDRLRLARRRLRMTQKDLAGEDFHRSLISQIETGLIEPSLQTLLVLADRVGLPATFFVQTEGEKKRADAALEEARSFTAKGQTADAYNRLLEALPVVGNFSLKAKLLVHVGRLLIEDDRPAEALGFLETARHYLRVDENADGLVEALAYLGHAQMLTENYSAAAQAYTEALWLLERFFAPATRQERTDLRIRQMHLALRAGAAFVHLQQFEEAMEWLEKSVSLATEVGLYEHVGRGHQVIACVHHECGRYDDAERHNKMALGCFDRPEHALDRAICLFNIGAAYLARKDVAASVSFYTQALTEKISEPELLLSIYTGLALAHYVNREYEKAAEWNKKATAAVFEHSGLFRSQVYARRVLDTFLLLARIYQAQDKPTDALCALEKGFEWLQGKRDELETKCLKPYLAKKRFD